MWIVIKHEGQKRPLGKTVLLLMVYIFAALTTELSDVGKFVRISN